MTYIQDPVFADEAYDLIILNGRVMDSETNLDAVSNVGITDGKIVIITANKINCLQGHDYFSCHNHRIDPGPGRRSVCLLTAHGDVEHEKPL